MSAEAPKPSNSKNKPKKKIYKKHIQTIDDSLLNCRQSTAVTTVMAHTIIMQEDKIRKLLKKNKSSEEYINPMDSFIASCKSKPNLSFAAYEKKVKVFIGELDEDDIDEDELNEDDDVKKQENEKAVILPLQRLLPLHKPQNMPAELAELMFKDVANIKNAPSLDVDDNFGRMVMKRKEYILFFNGVQHYGVYRITGNVQWERSGLIHVFKDWYGDRIELIDGRRVQDMDLAWNDFVICAAEKNYILTETQFGSFEKRVNKLEAENKAKFEKRQKEQKSQKAVTPKVGQKRSRSRAMSPSAGGTD